jgi:hypothetical protein
MMLHNLRRLIRIETGQADMTIDGILDYLGEYVIESVVPGICCSGSFICDYTCDVEPDSDKGWCEECCKQSVVSCLRLAGLV